MPNIIYVLTNEAMPGLVKIGLTNDNIESRIGQLSAATGVPLPFECFFAAEVKDCNKLEKSFINYSLKVGSIQNASSLRLILKKLSWLSVSASLRR